MLDSIKKILAPPVFEDEEKNRIGRILHFILLSIIVLLSGLLIAMVIYFDRDAFLGRAVVANTILVLLMIGCLFLVRWGYVRTASIVLVTVSWINLTYQAWFAAGIRDSAFIAYVIIILVANLLLGWRAGIIVAGLSILAGWVFAYAEANGLIITSIDPSYEIAAEITVIYGLAAVILALTTAGLSNALQRARSSEKSFADSNRELRTLSESLEQQVAARTRRLETVAALSERLSAILDVDALLNEVVNQIKDNFNYYHAHIYLLDDEQENLVMEAGTGSAGAEMKAKGHSISLQAVTSLIVRSARTSQVVTIDNVRESLDWLPNLLLPDTYSEMAVPIVLDGQVVGVLDVQEDKIAGLDDGDAGLLRSLANQVAVAIRNARLFAEVEASLTETREAQERYVEQSWQKMGRIKDARHLYSQPNIKLSDEEQRQMMIEARKQAATQGHPVGVDNDSDEKSLVTPINLRDKTIGVLKIRATDDEQHMWNEDDLAMIETIVDQVAQTAENMRLFEETRQRAGQEQTIREITDKLRSAPNLDALLETAARELGLRLGARHTVLEMGIETDTNGSDRHGGPVETGRVETGQAESDQAEAGQQE